MALADHLRSLHQGIDCVQDQHGCNASHVEEGPQDSIHNDSVLTQIVFMSMSISSSAGLIGNIFVICFLSGTAQVDVMSRYVVSRAFADVLLLLTVPFDVAAYFFHSWIFGTVLCQLRNALSLMAPFVSSVFQVGMCVNAYIEVCELAPHSKLRSAIFKIMSFISWSLCLIFGTSVSLQSEILKEVSGDRVHCVSWLLMLDIATSRAFRILTICFVFLAPLAFSWVFVLLTIPRQQSEGSYTYQQMANGSLTLEKRLKQLSLSVTLAFTICQAPYWLPYLVLESVENMSVVESVKSVFPVTMSLPALNTAINSVLYMLCMRDIRQYVKKMQIQDQPMIPLLPMNST